VATFQQPGGVVQSYEPTVIRPSSRVYRIHYRPLSGQCSIPQVVVSFFSCFFGAFPPPITSQPLIESFAVYFLPSDISCRPDKRDINYDFPFALLRQRHKQSLDWRLRMCAKQRPAVWCQSTETTDQAPGRSFSWPTVPLSPKIDSL